MEKKIVVPVTLHKDARLAELDVDLEVVVSCNLSRQVAKPKRTSSLKSLNKPIRPARKPLGKGVRKRRQSKSKIDAVLDELLPRSKRR